MTTFAKGDYVVLVSMHKSTSMHGPDSVVLHTDLVQVERTRKPGAISGARYVLSTSVVPRELLSPERSAFYRVPPTFLPNLPTPDSFARAVAELDTDGLHLSYGSAEHTRVALATQLRQYPQS